MSNPKKAAPGPFDLEYVQGSLQNVTESHYAGIYVAIKQTPRLVTVPCGKRITAAKQCSHNDWICPSVEMQMKNKQGKSFCAITLVGPSHGSVKVCRYLSIRFSASITRDCPPNWDKFCSLSSTFTLYMYPGHCSKHTKYIPQCQRVEQVPVHFWLNLELFIR